MIRIFHRRAKCIGCNACVEADRSRWRMSRKDGKSNLLGGRNIKSIYRAEADEDELPRLKQAVSNCPVRIITLQMQNH